MRRTMWTGVLCAAALVGLPADIAIGQQGPKPAPTENRGLRYEALPGLDLTGQIEGVTGRQFRVRRLTVEPGGHSALHEHRDRPAILHILEGSIVEHRDGSEPREHRAGQAVPEPVETRHWIENRSSTPTVLITVDLFKP